MPDHLILMTDETVVCTDEGRIVFQFQDSDYIIVHETVRRYNEFQQALAIIRALGQYAAALEVMLAIPREDRELREARAFLERMRGR
jgi:hypothetical protein